MIDRVLVQCRTRGAIKHIWCGDRADGGGDQPACRPPPLFFSFRANNNNLSAATGNNNGRRARARAWQIVIWVLLDFGRTPDNSSRDGLFATSVNSISHSLSPLTQSQNKPVNPQWWSPPTGLTTPGRVLRKRARSVVTA